MRRVCLGEPVARTGKLPTLSPPLLRHLAAIGNNLNQTARKVNSGQWSSIDRVHVVAALMAIEGELRQLRQAVREQGVSESWLIPCQGERRWKWPGRLPAGAGA